MGKTNCCGNWDEYGTCKCAEPAKKEGLRFNEGKTRHDLVPSFAQEQYARVLTLGAEKYAERNWELGMKWSKVISSLERHLQAVKKGEDFDKESGLLHSAHIMCNAAFLTEYYCIYPQGDDRPHSYLSHPKIGLDIDEVICDWVGGWCEYRGLERPKSWYFDRGLVDEFKRMEDNGDLDDFYMNLNPLISPEDIPFEPDCYITSRPVSTEVTERWLHLHNFPAKPVFTTTKERTKLVIAKEQDLEIFVDDSFDNFKALNKNGIFCYLKDAPHNTRYDVGFRRIKSLKELNFFK